ncbi:hypothetical protein, partial [Acinetobacter baumannii]
SVVCVVFSLSFCVCFFSVSFGCWFCEFGWFCFWLLGFVFGFGFFGGWAGVACFGVLGFGFICVFLFCLEPVPYVLIGWVAIFVLSVVVAFLSPDFDALFVGG